MRLVFLTKRVPESYVFEDAESGAAAGQGAAAQGADGGGARVCRHPRTSSHHTRVSKTDRTFRRNLTFIDIAVENSTFLLPRPTI